MECRFTHSLANSQNYYPPRMSLISENTPLSIKNTSQPDRLLCHLRKFNTMVLTSRGTVTEICSPFSNILSAMAGRKVSS